MVIFFFFKQKTAYEMRISDWSSDVCSSDLPGEFACWPQGCAITAAELEALEFAPGHREIEKAASSANARGVLALAVDHRGTHLRSVLALQVKATELELSTLRRAAGHLAQADRKSTRLNSSH